MPDTYRIAVLPGDGTGPEVVREGLKVLAATGFKLDLDEFDLGGERYKKTGDILPDSVLEELRGFDAIYLGAIGHPDVAPGILEKGLLLRLRFELDQYINLRPVKLYPGVDCPLKDKGPEDIDFVVVRENTEGLYSGMGGFQYKGTPQETSTQVHMTTRFGAERAIRYAFDLTRKRNDMASSTSSPRRTSSPSSTTPGGAPSTRSARPTTPTSSASTPTSTPPGCGSSRTPSGSTSSSSRTCSATSSRTSAR